MTDGDGFCITVNNMYDQQVSGQTLTGKPDEVTCRSYQEEVIRLSSAEWEGIITEPYIKTCGGFNRCNATHY